MEVGGAFVRIRPIPLIDEADAFVGRIERLALDIAAACARYREAADESAFQPTGPPRPLTEGSHE